LVKGKTVAILESRLGKLGPLVAALDRARSS
jgi:hypothetical protein